VLANGSGVIIPFIPDILPFRGFLKNLFAKNILPVWF